MVEWLNKWRIQKLLTGFRLLAAMGSATKAQVAEAFGADTFGAAIVPARTPMLGYEKLLPAPESAIGAVSEQGTKTEPIMKLGSVWAVV